MQRSLVRAHLTPIMLGLLAVAAAPAQAGDYLQVVLDPPASNNIHTVLRPGDTVTYGRPGTAVSVSGSNSLRGDGVSVTATNPSAMGLLAASGGIISLTNSSISGFSAGAYALDGGHIELVGGSVVSAAGPTLSSKGAGAAIHGKNLTITSLGSDPRTATGVGVFVDEGAQVSLEASEITTSGLSASVQVRNPGSVAYLRDTRIFYQGNGGRAIAVFTGGRLEMTGGAIRSLADSAVSLAGGVITLTGVDIQHGENGSSSVGYGISAGDIASSRSNVVTLEHVSLRSSYVALNFEGTGTTLSAHDSVVNASGEFARGLVIGYGATATLDNTSLLVEGGENSYGILGAGYFGSVPPAVTIRNGSQISTKGGAALGVGRGGVSDGTYAFLVSDSSISSKDAHGDAEKGVLLWASSPVGDSAARAYLDASHAFLRGDLVVESQGVIDVSLKSGSVLTGAALQRATGQINSVTLDASSTWNVRGDSTLGTLSNAGLVAFAAPAGGGSFKTLTVGNYVGGGTLVLNTWLGDDAAATDRLIIDGGSATGTTGLRVINAGGAGSSTGIRVVQTINGGTTASNAFHLDAGSSGYRASAGTIALNGYDYSLVRGGNGGAAPDWYLTSSYGTPAPGPTDPTDPTTPPNPTNPAGPAAVSPPLKPGFQNVSPESGAYIGNQLASTRLFIHGLHDRVAAYGVASADAPTADGVAARTGRGVWTRVEGRQDSGLGLTQGRVDIATDSSVLQLGADLIKLPLGGSGALYGGLMGATAMPVHARRPR